MLIQLKKCLMSWQKKLLTIIDENGAYLLKTDSFCLLDISLVKLILSRDSLILKNELSVFFILNRWSKSQCSLLSISPTPAEKHKILGGVKNYLPLVRFLTLTRDELQYGQTKTELLPQSYMNNILKTVIGGSHCSCPLPHDLQTVREKISKPRSNYSQVKPISHESKKSEVKVWDCEAQEYKLIDDDDDYETVDDGTLDRNIEGVTKQAGALGNYHRQNNSNAQHVALRIKKKKCNCVWVRTSKIIDIEEKRRHNKRLQCEHMGQLTLSSQESRMRRPRSNSWGQERHRDKCNTLEKIFYCLACVFD